MDLKVAFVIVCLCALAITSTEAGIPKCCVKTRMMVRKDVLMNIERQYEQLSGGICDIPALVLYIKHMKKPICASPKLKPMVDRLMEKRYNRLKAAP